MSLYISIFIVFLFIGIWSFLIEPNMLRVQKYQIQNKNLAGLKVVFAGDFHVKKYQEKRLQKVIKTINAQNPDIVLLIGDYINEHDFNATLPLPKITNYLSQIKSKYGVYSVLGNHDWLANGEKVTEALTESNIKVLANSNIKVNVGDKNIYIAGVEDLQTRMPNVFKALIGSSKPVILLTHTPDIFSMVPESVDLTLAGHVHGGQVRLPFVGALIVPSQYGNKYSQGLIEEDNKKMIVTRGIGTSILPVRFNCPPEIDVIEFKN
jgi:predicted MPP superfamily phosphohydrolase